MTSRGSTAPSMRTSRTSERSSDAIRSPPSSGSATSLSLNLRLIALVVALLAVTIGGIAVISTRVAHVEIRKFDLRERRVVLQPGQTLQSVFAIAAKREAPSNVAVFDANRRLIAATLHASRIDLDPSGTLTYDTAIRGGRIRQMIRGPQAIIRDRAGSVAGFL